MGRAISGASIALVRSAPRLRMPFSRVRLPTGVFEGCDAATCANICSSPREDQMLHALADGPFAEVSGIQCGFVLVNPDTASSMTA